MVGPGARVRFLGNLAEVDVHFLLLFFNGQEMNRSGIKKGQRVGVSTGIPGRFWSHDKDG